MQWVVILEFTVVSGYFARRAEVMDDGAACKPKATNLAGQRDIGTMPCDGRDKDAKQLRAKKQYFTYSFFVCLFL